MLAFTRFEKEHFQEYRTWYDDPDLSLALGPLDQEWLDFVTAETDGNEYAVFEDGEMVAVIGIKFPTPEHSAYAITDLAVKPALRGKGIGSRVLEGIMECDPCKSGQSWIAFVDEKNPRARSFLERNGWVCRSETPDEYGMMQMIFTEQAH